MEDQFEKRAEDHASIPPPLPPVQEIDAVPPMKPNNWLWQSIVATVLCCLPFGVVAIVYAVRVDSLYFNGQYADAEKAAKRAKVWTLLAFAFGVVYLTVSLVMLYMGVLPSSVEHIIENNASGYNF